MIQNISNPRKASIDTMRFMADAPSTFAVVITALGPMDPLPRYKRYFRISTPPPPEKT
jgi:hypothetical protein